MRPERLPLLPYVFLYNNIPLSTHLIAITYVHFFSPEDVEGLLGVAGRWTTDVIREADTVKQSLIAFSTVLASISPLLSIVLHGRGASSIRLVVSIVGTVLAVLGMVIVLAQKIVSILDAVESHGA